MLTLMLAAHVSATAHCATLIRAWFSDLGFDWEHERAQLAQILDLFLGDSQLISNDVGRCQDTRSPFRPPEPALIS
jgi:hypothetical protein